MIQTQNLSFQYSPTLETLRFPDINLGRKENLLVLGKSGIGKTTLLHLMAGLLKPKSGAVTVEGIELQELSVRKRDRFTGQHIGMVFQKNYAIRSLNLLENLEARLYFSEVKVKKEQSHNLLEQLGLTAQKFKKVNQLSEGQLQRLTIALAVVHQPKVILADEPTSSLDDVNCELVMRLLLEQAAQQKANLIVITHDTRIKPLFQNIITL
ncbi:putative ABC transport system ATP-binding protein [Leeuwenhoekiella aestuarii]|uniref:Putative ABC transport system ATP-binding protein n=1 Tax=Leeuwenhoekiella aestuarii TaxID=2249426 RepID=A0A4Q0NPT5_9FLAO|nr:ATP-binding cassette domain-containing protein [Leeuwenhoekiella aestuarii]RXG11219.1 putative ABC transport system ATP-binding protein [Leeuwenhoekiella aestuarii]RXG11585.1 putative ABC transport system ATP-binding protein [Leeuwenhoekiella aestuarii]